MKAKFVIVEGIGLNVQEPWATQIISGIKSIETRRYPPPQKYLGRLLHLVATKRLAHPKSAIIGSFKIKTFFKYQDETAFRMDEPRHLISKGNGQYDFGTDSQKWGWEIEVVSRFMNPIPKRGFGGIIWTKVAFENETDQ